MTLIEVALKEVGTIEGPRNNETKYGKFTKHDLQPWCGSFIMWCANEAGVELPDMVYTPSGAAAFKKMGKWFEDNPQPGDIAFFDFPNDKVNRISHVGIVLECFNDGSVKTVEGNTQRGNKGDQRNGGEVCIKIRRYKSPRKTIVGFGRP